MNCDLNSRFDPYSGLMHLLAWASLNTIANPIHRWIQNSLYENGSITVFFAISAVFTLLNISIYIILKSKWRYLYLIAAALNPILSISIGSVAFLPAIFALIDVYLV